jgi:hypothetical protein
MEGDWNLAQDSAVGEALHVPIGARTVGVSKGFPLRLDRRR